MGAAFLVLSILLFSLTSKLLPTATADAAPEAVLDVNGKILRAGSDYYILPEFRTHGGVVTMARTGNETYPLDVIRPHYGLSKGLPITFTPENPKKGVVCLSSDLNIKFSAALICVQSIVLKLEKLLNQNTSS